MALDVKKVPNGRLQGSAPGETDFRDFPFRLRVRADLTSNDPAGAGVPDPVGSGHNGSCS
jgi:hypothetical protein